MALVQPGTLGKLNVGGSEYRFGRPVFRQSNLKDFHACNRLFFLRHVLGLSPNVEKRSVSADTGTFWHKAMQTYYETPNPVDPQREATLACEDLLCRICKPLEAQEAEDLTGTVPQQIEDLTMCCNKGLAMAAIFFDRFPICDGLEVVATEQPIVVPFKLSTGQDILVRVKSDLIIRGNDKLWVVDHKSSGDKPEDVMVGKPWSFQTRLYAWAVRNHYQEPLGGFIYNKMQMPGIKLCGKDEKGAEAEGTTPEEFYLKRVVEWYEKQPHQTIESVWIPCSGEYHLDPGLQGLLKDIHDRIRFFSDTSPAPLTLFPQDGSCWNCRKFNRTCPYMAICDTDPVAWCHTIAGFYQQDLEELPEQGEEQEEETHAESRA